MPGTGNFFTQAAVFLPGTGIFFTQATVFLPGTGKSFCQLVFRQIRATKQRVADLLSQGAYVPALPIKRMTQIEAEPLRQSHPQTPKSAIFPKGSKSWVLSPMFALVVVGGTRCTPTSALTMDPPTSARGSAQKWVPRGPRGTFEVS